MKESRRQFLGELLRGTGAAGLLAAGGCGPGTFFEDNTRVDDRFNEAMAGHGKPLVFPEAVSDNFTFIWFSDLHMTGSGNHALDRIGRYADRVRAAMIFCSGDLVDRGLETEYARMEQLAAQYLPAPFFSALGNHDLYNGGWARFKSLVGPSVFRFGYGPCDFVFIDAANGTVGKDQLNWMEDELPKLSRPHRFVFGHYPLYQGTVQTPGSMGNTEERLALFQLFDQSGIDFYLSGHIHVGSSFDIRGVHHVVTGAACPDKAPTSDDNHFYRFDITPNDIKREKILVRDIP